MAAHIALVGQPGHWVGLVILPGPERVEWLANKCIYTSNRFLHFATGNIYYF